MKYELINYCENDKYAKKAYSLIHNEPESKNLGDITLVNEKEIADFNWMVGGSPCQDFSVAGKGKGAVWTCKNCKDDEGNDYQYNPLEVHYAKRDKCPKCNSTNIEKTRSSLVVEWLRILHAKKPNIAIYENVKNLVGKKHKHFFDLFINELQEYGYNTYYKVLNAKDYGIPQNRERIYVVVIKKELDNGKFQFPKSFKINNELKKLLDDIVEDKYYLTKDEIKRIRNTDFKKDTYKKHTIEICDSLLNETCKIDFLICDYRYDEGIRIRKDNICPCLTTKSIIKSLSGKPMVIMKGKLRQLTHFEILKLMGFDEKDYKITIENGISESQISKQAGNSIVVDVLYYIYLELYKAMPYLFEDIKLGSFFSGIGAFEKAIVRLQETIHNQINKGM